MSDLTPLDIHRLDQAAPDALASVDQLLIDQRVADRLAAHGTATTATELTIHIHDTLDGRPMALAGLAAMAVVRLAQAGDRLDELNTQLGTAPAVRRQRDALHAQVAELTAELEQIREVVDAAKTWRWSGDTADGHREAKAALMAAIDALPTSEATR